MAADKARLDRLFARAQRMQSALTAERVGHALVETFPQQQGSRSRPARPRAGGRQAVSGPGVAVAIGQRPCGQLVLTSVSGDLGNGNEPVVFDAATRQVGFDQTVFPTTQIVLPCSAVYGIEGSFRWTDGYTGGGTVTLVVDGAVYLTVEAAAEWNRFSLAEEFDADAGQTLSIYIDHDDTTSDHELEGQITLAGKELKVETVIEPLSCPAEDLDWKLGTDGNGQDGTTDKPTDTAAGDLLVAFGANRHSITTSLTMSGFTEREFINGSAGETLTLAIMTKIATGSEPSSYSWSWNGSGAAAGVVYVVRIPGTLVQHSSSRGAQPHDTPDIGAIASGQLLLGLAGKYDTSPTDTVPDDTTEVDTTTFLTNRSVTLFCATAAGTSVRTIDRDAPAEAICAVGRFTS